VAGKSGSVGLPRVQDREEMLMRVEHGEAAAYVACHQVLL
jgi:hypothetical protein